MHLEFHLFKVVSLSLIILSLLSKLIIFLPILDASSILTHISIVITKETIVINAPIKVKIYKKLLGLNSNIYPNIKDKIIIILIVICNIIKFSTITKILLVTGTLFLLNSYT